MKPQTTHIIKVVETDCNSLKTPVGDINIPLP